MDTIENKELAFLSCKLIELNKRLMESEQSKTSFLSLVACELNNPMTALLGLIPHLAPPEGDPKETIYSLVHEQALLLDFRIQNVVAASMIESGVSDISNASTDPKSILDEVIESLKYTINTKNIMIVIENFLHEKVITDPQKFYLILKNLVANGCDYGITGGIITIAMDKINDMFEIRVTNQGSEPNVEFKAQLLTRFSLRSDGIHGMGLGLSIVHYLSESMGGKVDYTVKNQTVTFVVSLPWRNTLADSDACGSNEFLFESFDDAIEL